MKCLVGEGISLSGGMMSSVGVEPVTAGKWQRVKEQCGAYCSEGHTVC